MEEIKPEDLLNRQIITSSDPQRFEGVGEEVWVYFHDQDERLIPLDFPRHFVCETIRENPRYIRFREVGDDIDEPLELIHKRKDISPANFYDSDAVVNVKRLKLLAGGALSAIAVGAILYVNKRK